MTDAREVVTRVVEAFNAHDEEGIRSMYAENCRLEAPGDVRLEGLDQVMQNAMSWMKAFPDAASSVRNQVVAGEWVIQEFTFEGTHKETLTGPTGEIPPTNRRVTGRGAEIFRVQDGKIVEDHLYFDQVELMTQLGLMPEPATT